MGQMLPRKQRNFKVFLIVLCYLIISTAISNYFGLSPLLVIALTISPLIAFILLIFAGLVQGLKHLDEYDEKD